MPALSPPRRPGRCSHRLSPPPQGILDILVLSKGYTKNDFAIHALKNNFEADAYFVKVIGECLPCVFY